MEQNLVSPGRGHIKSCKCPERRVSICLCGIRLLELQPRILGNSSSITYLFKPDEEATFCSFKKCTSRLGGVVSSELVLEILDDCGTRGRGRVCRMSEPAWQQPRKKQKQQNLKLRVHSPPIHPVWVS